MPILEKKLALYLPGIDLKEPVAAPYPNYKPRFFMGRLSVTNFTRGIDCDDPQQIPVNAVVQFDTAYLPFMAEEFRAKMIFDYKPEREEAPVLLRPRSGTRTRSVPRSSIFRFTVYLPPVGDETEESREYVTGALWRFPRFDQPGREKRYRNLKGFVALVGSLTNPALPEGLELREGFAPAFSMLGMFQHWQKIKAEKKIRRARLRRK